MFKKVYIMYCPVCGYVDGEHTKTVCPFCGHELSNSNHLLKEMRGKFRWEIEPIAEDIFQELVKDNPEFNSTKYQLREGKEKERKRLADERVQRKWDAQKAEYEKFLPNAPLTRPAVPPAAAPTLNTDTMLPS